MTVHPIRPSDRARSRRRRPSRRPGPILWLVLIGIFAVLAHPPQLAQRIMGNGVSEPAAAQGGVFPCIVAYVNDGDTLRCTDGTRVRLQAISARETDGSCRKNNPCPSASAGAATATLKRTVTGRTLQCEATGTSYNRITAWCAADGDDVSCQMLRSGTVAYWPKFDRQRRVASCA